MITAGMLSNAATADPAARQALAISPSWRWGNRVTGDPLRRADDKGFSELSGKPGTLALMVATIRDARTRAEIRSRAERKQVDLEQQLQDVRRWQLTALEPEAERELADQRAFLEILAQADDMTLSSSTP
jgi:hypothetical protein